MLIYTADIRFWNLSKLNIVVISLYFDSCCLQHRNLSCLKIDFIKYSTNSLINAEDIFESRRKYSHVRGFVSEFQSNTRKKIGTGLFF